MVRLDAKDSNLAVNLVEYNSYVDNGFDMPTDGLLQAYKFNAEEEDKLAKEYNISYVSDLGKVRYYASIYKNYFKALTAGLQEAISNKATQEELKARIDHLDQEFNKSYTSFSNTVSEIASKPVNPDAAQPSVAA